MAASFSALTTSKGARLPAHIAALKLACKCALLRCSHHSCQWMCRKMCSLARESFDDDRKPEDEGHEAKRGAVLACRLCRYQRQCLFAGELISTHMIDGGTGGFDGAI
jgi:hypothetical protein